MLHLALAELREAPSVWVGTATVTGTGGYATGLVTSLVVTAGDLDGTSALALYGISGTALAFTAIAVIVTVSSISELTLALLRRRLAVWLLAGVSPVGLTAAVLSQLVIVAAIGATAGAVLAATTASQVVGAALDHVSTLADVPVHLGGTGTLVVVGVIVCLTAYAGLRPALRAGRSVGVDPRRDPPDLSQAMGASRWVGTVLTAAALASVVTSAPGSVDPGTALLLVAPLTAAVLTAGAPLFVARWLRHWTRLVAKNPLPTWFLARAQAGELLTRSTGPIGPLLVTIALSGGLWATSAATRPSPGDGDAGAVGLLVVLAAPLVVTIVGSAATVVMLDSGRKSTTAVAQNLGATRRQLISIAVTEIAIIITTSAALGAICTGATLLTAAWSVSPDAAVAAIPATIVALGCASLVCFAIQVAAVIPPVVLSTRRLEE
ncbi:hypothetical protein [Cellulosimicrobium cellulans]|uniref:hypothetical protein n=1 Tax=Cellulosimicrobium cellulans TaxID=1710 RepID=UPI0030167007